MRRAILLSFAFCAVPLLAASSQVQKTYYEGGPVVAEVQLEQVENPRPVTIAVTAPGAATPARITVREGALARIDNETDGRSFAIAARVVDEMQGLVEARFFEVTRYADGREGLRVLAGFNLAAGVPFEAARTPEPQAAVEAAAVEPVSEDTFTFALVGVGVAGRAAKTPCVRTEVAATAPDGDAVSALAGADPDAPCTRCCISCDGWRYCGCAVQACGTSCCCDPCC